MQVSPTNAESEPKIGLLNKLWQLRKLLIIEPLLICAILPLGLLSVTILNFSLEKACRVNLGYNTSICANVLDKKLNNVECAGIKFEHDDFDTNGSLIVLDTNITSSLNYIVCKAEQESQKVVTIVNAIRGPMSSIFPIIVILFAGGWSDRSGLRKPCMLFPLIGEVLSLSAHILSSVFMDTIPMEFGAIVEKLLPSMFGGQTLLTIGVLSYLTETTAENDRAFRFGIFTVCLNIVQLIGVSFSGVMFNLLGYVNMFIIGDCFFIVAIIYLVFFIPEIKRKTDLEKERETFAYNISEWSDMPVESNKSCYSLTPTIKQKNCLLDFFDPASAYDCVKVFLKKREANGRLFLILLVILYMLIVAPSDHEYIYLFTMKNLKWNGDVYSGYLTYSIIIGLVGTFLMTGVFIKIFKLSNAMAGFIATLLSGVSNLFMAFSTTTAIFYTAISINLFSHCKGIVINAIISSFIDKEEIGRVYSVLGITAAICGLVFPLLYAYIYSSTIETFPGAIFLLSEVFLVPAILFFGIIFFMMRQQNKIKEKIVSRIK